LQGVGVQGRAGVVAQLYLCAVKTAADVGSEQFDCSGLGVTDDSCPGQAEQAAAECCAIERWLIRVFDLASGQPEARQRTTGSLRLTTGLPQ
jgi:hypothetical protein